MIRVSIVGGSGYGGGELLPCFGSSRSGSLSGNLAFSPGEYVYQVHPNLRKRTQLTFLASCPTGTGRSALSSLAPW
jgi:N-acetyl-gamma-glutamyl-phosphate/LysW-gamma-L-alpha-aminoadipyl-6-phosphate reductase